MFRSITKITKILRVSHYNCANYTKPVGGPGATSYQEIIKDSSFFEKEHEYFQQNAEYITFDRNDKNLHQFDTESRAVTIFNLGLSNETSNWKNISIECTNEDLVRGFQDTLEYCINTGTSLCSEQFDKFIDQLTKQLLQFSTNELICALQIFAKFPVSDEQNEVKNYSELFIAFDQASTIKASEWDLNQILYACSIWCCIPNAKRSFFAKLAGRSFNRCVKSMSTQQLTQSMSYLNYMRRPIDDIRTFENIFDSNINLMTLEEFSIVCRNFVRLNTALQKPELRNTLFEFVLKNDLNQLNDHLLTNVLLIIQKSARFQHGKSVVLLLENLRKSLDGRSLQTCILVSHVGMKLRICNEELIEYTLQRCLNQPEIFSTLTILEFEQLSEILGLFNFTTKSHIAMSIANGILDQLRNRLSKITYQSFHTHCIQILHYLSLINVYDVDIIDNIFHPDFMFFMHKRNKILDPELLYLDGYARINLNGIYAGHLLDNSYLEKMGEFQTNYVPDRENQLKKTDDFVIEVENTISNLFKYYNYANATPYYKHADIFVCIDKTTMETVDISESYPPPYTGKYITVKSLVGDKTNLELYAFVPAHTKMLLYGTDQATGVLNLKCEQLKILGFHPIMISWPMWKTMTEVERTNFIKEKFGEKFREIRSRQA